MSDDTETVYEYDIQLEPLKAFIVETLQARKGMKYQELTDSALGSETEPSGADVEEALRQVRLEKKVVVYPNGLVVLNKVQA